MIAGIRAEMDEVTNHLDHLIEYAIDYFRQIRKKYGKGRERKTELRNFDTIQAVKVAAPNQKLYVNRGEGFAGTSLRKDEYICDCSDIDDIIVFRDDGTFTVTRVAEKVFVGQGIMVLFLTFFLLLGGHTFKRKLVRLIGPTLSNKKITVQILDDINDSIQKYLFMLLATNVLVALLNWIALRWIVLVDGMGCQRVVDGVEELFR